MMLVDVRPLRQQGQRVDRERVRQLAPKRGELSVHLQPDHWRIKRFSVATLCAQDDLVTYLLPPLAHVQVRRWMGRQVLLIGMEQIVYRRIREEYPQAWWVQLVADPAPLETPPPAPGG
jgi:hypothetical protein